MLRIAGRTRCVVVPNIVRPPVGGASYSGFNQALADLAKHHDNLRVADWAGLVSRNRGWLAGDGVARQRDRLPGARARRSPSRWSAADGRVARR